MSSTDLIMGAAGASAPATYVEDVFSTYLYTGTGAAQTINNGIALASAPISVSFTTPTTISATACSLSVVDCNNVGVFVSIGNNSGAIYVTRSLNGTTWTAPSLMNGVSTAGTILEIASNSTGRFVAVGYNSSNLPIFATSTDGTTWTTPATMNGSTTVAYMYTVVATSSGGFYSMGSDSSGNAVYATSVDGTSWTTPAYVSGSAFYFNQPKLAISSSGRYVAVALDSSGSASVCITSTNGTTWSTPVALAGSGSMQGIAVNSSGLFVIVGSNPSGYPVYTTSTDGVTWSTVTTMNGSTTYAGLQSLAVNSSGRFVAVGKNSTPSLIYATSADGTTWTTPLRMNGSTIATSFGDVAVAVNSSGLFVSVGCTQTTALPLVSSGVSMPAITGNGGLVWIKSRSAATSNFLFDTTRGALNEINSDGTAVQVSLASSLTAFNSNGFTLGSATGINVSAATYASWTFREQPKFFDVVTFTGNGGGARNIAHGLGSAPGMIILKATSSVSDWYVYHRSIGAGASLLLNSTGVVSTGAWNNTNPTSSVFSISSALNVNGVTFVAYLFAHDAGGFGDTGTDNVISCGSYVGDQYTTGAAINLGWEPQFILVKAAIDGTSNWTILDSTRGMPITDSDSTLTANTNTAEGVGNILNPLATGFEPRSTVNQGGVTYIYMAIRRPMKTPTNGAEVFNSTVRNGTGANATVSSGFVTDTVIEGNRTSITSGTKFGVWNRLRGTGYNITNTTAAEVAGGATLIQANPWDVMDGYKVGTTSALTNSNTTPFINWMFKRATGFHDVVCYKGDGATGGLNYVAHNLGVLPELILLKRRNAVSTWRVAMNQGVGNQLVLNTTAAQANPGVNYIGYGVDFLELGSGTDTNAAGGTYVALLFATLPGVSKCGSYTGNGTNQTIDCGFSGGARFVMIKRTDSTSDWLVFDTARGIVAANDPTLALNTTNAEITTIDSVDPTSSGFIVNQVASNINVNTATYTFLAIA